jgi:small conductance mechanosensitive channel
VSESRRSVRFWLVLLLALLAYAPALAETPPPDETEPELVAEGRALLESLLASQKRRNELEERAAKARGRPRQILEEQAWQATSEAGRILRAIAENLVQQEDAGLDTSEMRELLTGMVQKSWPITLERIRHREEQVQAVVSERENATPEERASLEDEATATSQVLVAFYSQLVEAVLALERVDLDLSEQRAFLEERLAYHADYLAAAATLAFRERDQVRARLDATPDDAESRTELLAAERWAERSTHNLHAVAELMERVDMETAPYRQLLFEATGEITTDVLDRDVALGLLERWRTRLGEAIAEHGPRWLVKGFVFLAILAAFRLLAIATRRVVSRSLDPSRAQVSQLLRDSLVSWSSRAVMILGVLVAVSQLGIEIGPMLAGLGIAGFIIGFAMQDSLSNFAAGAMILIYRPFDVNDLIEAAGVRGEVKRMTLVTTTILTLDNQTLIIPNNKIWGDVIRNVTAQRIRRVDLVFGISYESDVDHAEAVLLQILEKDPRVLERPEPLVAVDSLGDSSVNFVVRPWVKTDDYWEVYRGITREVKKRFDEEGISIPYPQRDVHVYLTGKSGDGNA